MGVCAEVGAEGELETIYIPMSTAQRAFNGQDRVGAIMFTTSDAEFAQNQHIVDDIRNRLSSRHKFDPEDIRALFVGNTYTEFARFHKRLAGVRIFIWMVGIGTLIAGIMGVSNVLMIAVRERTREIGIRKAVGGTPVSIVSLLLQEAVLMTSMAGCIGLVLGVAILDVMSRMLPQSEYFRSPQVDLHAAVSAMLILVAAGAIAGFFPARRAAAIRPVEALRDE